MQVKNIKEHKDSFDKFYAQHGQITSWTAKYPTYMRLYAECRYERRNAEIMQMVGNSRGYILDLGCGVGDIVGALAREGNYAVGLEISEVNMISCKQNAKGAFLCLGIGEYLPFRNCSFDVVILADVIEHVVDMESVVSEIRRVLKSSGILILTTPNRWITRFWILCDWPWRLVSKVKRTRQNKHLLTVKDELLSAGEVQTLLTNGGFDIIAHRMIEFYPNTNWFTIIMRVIGKTLRTRLAEPLFRTLFKHLERLEHLNSRQFVLARKP